MEKIRWGVIGAGGIADRRTIPGLKKAKNAQLVSVMEVNLDFAEKIRAKHQAAKACDTIEGVLNDPDIDAVYIASPVIHHADQARAAADAGKHILLEKPLAISAAEAEKTVEHCQKRQVQIAAGLMMRFGTHVQTMKEAVQAGKIGQLVSGYAQFTCWYPDMPGNWRQDPRLGGGGALMDMGIHCLDLIQYISGSPITEVAAFNETLTFSYPVEDSSTVLLRLENGAQCVVQSNFNIPDEAARWRLEFFGSKGRLLGDEVIGQLDNGSLNVFYLTEQKEYDAIQSGQTAAGSNLSARFGDLYTRQIESFSNSLLTGGKLLVPAIEAVQLQRVVEAAYQASREKKTVRIQAV